MAEKKRGSNLLLSGLKRDEKKTAPGLRESLAEENKITREAAREINHARQKLKTNKGELK